MSEKEFRKDFKKVKDIFNVVVVNFLIIENKMHLNLRFI